MNRRWSLWLFSIVSPKESDTLDEVFDNLDEDFEKFFKKYYPAMLRFFARRGVAEGERDDLAQETFLRVHRHLDSYSGQGRLEGWLFKIASNLHLNTLRDRAAFKRGREESLENHWERLANTAPAQDFQGNPTDGDPLDNVLTAENFALLSEELLTLPHQMRRCFTMRVHQELKYREIAALLSISTETVKAHIYQARRRLQRSFAGHLSKEDGN